MTASRLSRRPGEAEISGQELHRQCSGVFAGSRNSPLSLSTGFRLQNVFGRLEVSLRASKNDVGSFGWFCGLTKMSWKGWGCSGAERDES